MGLLRRLVTLEAAREGEVHSPQAVSVSKAGAEGAHTCLLVSMPTLETSKVLEAPRAHTPPSHAK